MSPKGFNAGGDFCRRADYPPYTRMQARHTIVYRHVMTVLHYCHLLATRITFLAPPGDCFVPNSAPWQLSHSQLISFIFDVARLNSESYLSNIKKKIYQNLGKFQVNSNSCWCCQLPRNALGQNSALIKQHYSL